MAEPTRTPPPPPSGDAPSPDARAPAEDQLPWLEELPPRKIVAELDRYIVGQEVAKKAVAIAVRNSWRRAQASPEAEARAEERLLDILLPAAPAPPLTASPSPGEKGEGRGEKAPLFVVSSKGDVTTKPLEADTEAQERRRRSREKLRQQLKEGKLEERDVEVEVQQQGFPMLEMMQPPQGMEGPDVNFTEWLQEMLPKKK